jgi:hypothetical protein
LEQVEDSYPGTAALGVSVDVTRDDAQVAYQWFVNGAAVPGAVGTTYFATGPADVVVKVTVSAVGFPQVVKYSNHFLVPSVAVRY